MSQLTITRQEAGSILTEVDPGEVFHFGGAHFLKLSPQDELLGPGEVQQDNDEDVALNLTTFRMRLFTDASRVRVTVVEAVLHVSL